MADSETSGSRLRSATEFPKTVRHLEPAEAESLYEEMRRCLIFTNRSRSQLLRRNEEHKAKTALVKQDVQRLQGIIQRLTTEKQTISRENQHTIQALEAEMTTMATHLDELSKAFDTVADVAASRPPQWGVISLPARFFCFLRAVQAIVLWWRDDRPDLPPSENSVSSQTLLPSSNPDNRHHSDDRRDRPQMYDDPASRNRSLLDR
ncbi:hypothetical protein XM38_001180 [Halomicronema hongdechloris C2206]|uniref:Uncharacterized protein n=1 Tax=Halomicronema hongdechloris C2206 TaxID=1641165 RepID=A0A1Z3HFY3_9CYAN|nr:hypothetical protein [Halomicronema hongdechloris]ASC69192.1 hypothetical protein XM38_001180 [Halomicronema hongdechloris C2206]